MVVSSTIGERLEPGCVEAMRHGPGDKLGAKDATALATLSLAISLKRIADAVADTVATRDRRPL